MVSITDELRGFMDGADGYELWCPRHKVELESIADRIDVTHRSALEKLAVQLDETSDMREFCGRLEEAANNREDVTLWGVDYIPLPVDADGVPIHIGDVLYDCNESPSEKFSAAIMELNKWGWSLLDSYGERNVPSQCHHYQAPTVKDVLQKMLEQAVGYSDAHTTVALNTIAEYAAKLRLAGEDE